MMRLITAALGAGALIGASLSTAQAAVLITYQDVGSNLQFDYSGSLNASAFAHATNSFATVSTQLYNPLFWNSSGSGQYDYIGSDASVIHTPGPFATNLSRYYQVGGYGSGTSLMFRLNGGIPGPASSLQLWGDWGAANAPIVGQLVLTGVSAASIGMVDGWSVLTDWGSITFQAATPMPVAIPAALPLLASALGVFGFFGWRRRKAVAA